MINYLNFDQLADETHIIYLCWYVIIILIDGQMWSTFEDVKVFKKV